MVLRKCCTKVYYHYRAKEATLYDAVRAASIKWYSEEKRVSNLIRPLTRFLDTNLSLPSESYEITCKIVVSSNLLYIQLLYIKQYHCVSSY